MEAHARRRTGSALPGLAALCAAALALPAAALPRHPGDDPGALLRALERALHCEQVRLLAGARFECAPALPEPQRDFVEDVVALVYGPLLDAPGRVAGGAGLQCQHAIARSALRLLSGAGVAASPELAAACRRPVRDLGGGLRLPSVGPQCAAAIGPAGGAVDTSALHGCFARLLPRWLDRANGRETPLRPNVVLILTDDQRFDTLDGRLSRDGRPVMPASFEELAARGVSFRESFVSDPVCGPSRASLLTGQHAHSHGVLRNAGVSGGAIQLDDRSTVATWLQDAGYRTGFYGKYVNTYQTLRAERGRSYVPPGWDDWRALSNDLGNTYYDYELVENDRLVSYGHAEADYSTDVFARQALRLVDEAAAAGEPFFLLWSPSTPHAPYLPAPRHAGLFLDFEQLVPLDAPSFFEEDVSDKPAWVRALQPWSELGALGAYILRILQLQMLQSVDEFVATLMTRVRELGLADDTLVIFTSDNGLAWGEHRWSSKVCIYEECLRVPLVVRYPRLAPLPREETSFAVNVDLAPTLAELAGVPLPIETDGRSLLRVLDGTERQPAPPLSFECYSGTFHTFVGTRDERWKFAEHLTGERELYDLESDPFELENLAGRPEQAARVAALRARALESRPGWPNDLQ